MKALKINPWTAISIREVRDNVKDEIKEFVSSNEKYAEMEYGIDKSITTRLGYFKRVYYEMKKEGEDFPDIVFATRKGHLIAVNKTLGGFR